jgi:uncharacterized membrane protein YidH (DUF202 family)
LFFIHNTIEMANEVKQWSPLEISGIIALIAGIVFFSVGIILIITQTKAEGLLDLESGLFSGKLSSGSAGLFICLFGLIMIIYGLFQFKSTSRITNNSTSLLKNNKFLCLLFPFILLIIILIIYCITLNSTLLILAAILIIPFLKMNELK